MDAPLVAAATKTCIRLNSGENTMPKIKIELQIKDSQNHTNPPHVLIRNVFRDHIKHAKIQTRHWRTYARCGYYWMILKFNDDTVIGYDDFNEKYLREILDEIEQNGVCVPKAEVTVKSKETITF